MGEGLLDREGIRAAIKQFTDLGTAGLRANLIAFLRTSSLLLRKRALFWRFTLTTRPLFAARIVG